VESVEGIEGYTAVGESAALELLACQITSATDPWGWGADQYCFTQPLPNSDYSRLIHSFILSVTLILSFTFSFLIHFLWLCILSLALSLSDRPLDPCTWCIEIGCLWHWCIMALSHLQSILCKVMLYWNNLQNWI